MAQDEKINSPTRELEIWKENCEIWKENYESVLGANKKLNEELNVYRAERMRFIESMEALKTIIEVTITRFKKE